MYGQPFHWLPVIVSSRGRIARIHQLRPAFKLGANRVLHHFAFECFDNRLDSTVFLHRARIVIVHRVALSSSCFTSKAKSRSARIQ